MSTNGEPGESRAQSSESHGEATWISRDSASALSATEKEAAGLGSASSTSWGLKVVVFLVCLQAFLSGYIFAVLNSSTKTGNQNSPEACYDHSDNSCPIGTIHNDMHLSTVDISLATSLAILGAWIGCLFTSKPLDFYGRKKTLIGNSLFYILGAILCTITNKYTLFMGRFVSGIGVGVTSVACPILLAELAPADIRGGITTMYQVNVTASILIASVLGYIFVNNVQSGWAYLQGFELIPAMVFLVLAPKFVGESPKWLVANGQEEKAATVLKEMRVHNDTNSINKEMLLLIEEFKQQEAEASENGEVTWEEVLRDRRPLYIGCALMFMQAFTGINSVVFYSTTVFAIAGFKNAILGTCMWASVNVLATIGSASLMDKYGRKIFLLVGTSIMFVALLTLSTSLIIDGEHHNDVDNDSSGISLAGIIAVLSVLFFVFGFAIGLGAVIWVMMSELMGNRTRGKAVSIFLSINWASNFVIGMTSLVLVDAFGNVETDMDDDEINDARRSGVAYLYYLFAGITFFSVIVIYYFIPETKGKKPEDFVDFDTTAIDAPLLSKSTGDV
jgi:SP family facilitated glucose transporter-like MFS transporter 8